MEFLEIVPIFHGWDYRLFDYAVDAGIHSRGAFLRDCIFADIVYHCA